MGLIRVDMTDGQVTQEPLPSDRILGGRATIAHLLTKYGSPAAHPYSEESLFIAAPGTLAASGAPSSNRISVGGKSPLTGGIKEANAGGTAANKLGRLNVEGIVVEGKSNEWKVLKVDAQGAKLEPAGETVGMTNYAACDKLRQRYGDKIGIMIIGPAGEMKLANSTVAITDPDGHPARHCARGGLGAVMGAKGLKAIVIDDSGGSLRKPKDEQAFRAASKALAEAIRSHPWHEVTHTYGTWAFVEPESDRGSCPTHNHRMGSWDRIKNISLEKLVALKHARGGSLEHGCMPGCVVRCSSVFHDASKNYLTAAFEMETICMLGSNLGIDDLDAMARMDRKCDELGVDTIEFGGTVGVLNDVGLFEFGDAKRAEALLDEIARGTELGRIIGNGLVTTARVFGIDRVPAVKGQAIPAHMARALKGWGVTYATNPMGADHSAGMVVEDPLSPSGQIERSRKAQIAATNLDALGFCMFTFMHDNPEVIVPVVNAFCGARWTVDDYVRFGWEILKLERSFNVRAGIAPEADGVPEWLRTEPLPPHKTVFDVPQEEILAFWDWEV